MDLSQRADNNLHVCGIEIDFTSLVFPEAYTGEQPFYNSVSINSDFQSVYYSKGKVSFKEDSSESKAGVSYNQKVSFRFPNSDGKRAERIEEFRKARFVVIKFSDKSKLMVGRNDFDQNAKPKIKISSNTKTTLVEFSSNSIFPLGYFTYLEDTGFPIEIPINFININ